MTKPSDSAMASCIKLIDDNFLQRSKAFAQLAALQSSHGGISGSARETMWADLLREVLPQKFSLVQNVILIDSEGNVSHEVDVAAIDEQYTPYVFRCGQVKFVPIEAVVLVMECKSSSAGNAKLKEWSESISNLRPSAHGIARMVSGYCIGLTNQTQQATRPIRVFAALHGKGESLDDHFDIFISAGKEGLSVKIPNEGKKLAWWAHVLNNNVDSASADAKPMKLDRLDKEWDSSVSVRWEKNGGQYVCTSTLADLKVDGNELLSLNLQLNQLLMLMNNPMLFPHFAYAKLFRERRTK